MQCQLPSLKSSIVPEFILMPFAWLLVKDQLKSVRKALNPVLLVAVAMGLSVSRPQDFPDLTSLYNGNLARAFSSSDSGEFADLVKATLSQLNKAVSVKSH